MFYNDNLCVEIYCSVGRIKIKMNYTPIYFRFLWGFLLGQLLTSRIQIQDNEKIPLQIFENCGRET